MVEPKVPMTRPPPTLLRYNEPVLVKRRRMIRHIADPLGDEKITQAEGEKQEKKKEIEKILKSIFPPRSWEEKGKKWQQTISALPAVRRDIISTYHMLDKRLNEGQARETGICLVRRELFKQVYDEIIRQETLKCPERGLLLVGLRNETNKCISDYEALYCSSVGFGLRKAVQAHEVKNELSKRVFFLEKDNIELGEAIKNLENELEELALQEEEDYELEEKKFLDEVALIRKSNMQLKAQLESILAPKKKYEKK